MMIKVVQKCYLKFGVGDTRDFSVLDTLRMIVKGTIKSSDSLL